VAGRYVARAGLGTATLKAAPASAGDRADLAGAGEFSCVRGTLGPRRLCGSRAGDVGGHQVLKRFNVADGLGGARPRLLRARPAASQDRDAHERRHGQERSRRPAPAKPPQRPATADPNSAAACPAAARVGGRQRGASGSPPRDRRRLRTQPRELLERVHIEGLLATARQRRAAALVVQVGDERAQRLGAIQNGQLGGVDRRRLGCHIGARITALGRGLRDSLRGVLQALVLLRIQNNPRPARDRQRCVLNRNARPRGGLGRLSPGFGSSTDGT
jgi:hypothetical protein